MAAEYVLVKRGLYWRPEGKGYTGLLREAGRYDEDHPAVTVALAGSARFQKERTQAIPVDEADEFSPSCPQDVRDRELLERTNDGLAALENLLIAIGMGWDLEGVVDQAQQVLARAGR